MKKQGDERKRQIVAGALLLLLVTLAVCGTLVGWRHLPGILGEWVGVMIGVMTTPFFLEASFAVLGLTLVMLLNHWHHKKSGEELVYLEQVDPPAELPEHASWAVFRETPLAGEEPSLAVKADGALAIGDYDTASECLAAMTEEELKQPEVLALRLQLAKATGKADLARQLSAQLGALEKSKI